MTQAALLNQVTYAKADAEKLVAKLQSTSNYSTAEANPASEAATMDGLAEALTHAQAALAALTNVLSGLS